MPFALKNSVRVQLTLAFFLVVLISWVLSSATAYLVHQQQIHALRQQMLANPALYPHPIPEPRFNLLEMLIGVKPPPPRKPNPGRPPQEQPNFAPPPERQPGFNEPPPFDPQGPPPDRPGAFNQPPGMPGQPPPIAQPPREYSANFALFRGLLALGLAVLAGALLSRRFTKPLTALTRGARALHQGQFDFRVPVTGSDEFTEMATAMNEMASQISTQVRQLQDDAARRKQFLADVAHELKSPVTTLRTMAGALAEGIAVDPERHHRAVQSMLRTSDRLSHLVADLLMLARVDLQELPLHIQETDLRELAAACLQAHAGAATEASIILQPVEDGPPLLAKADPDRITQVLDNLLDNAISYAGAGAQISIILADEDPVRLSVIDTGQGVPPEHLAHLFDAFYRADTARTPGDNHSGLGLRIARGLIEAHGGSLTLASQPGEGTRVEITLPK